MTVWIRVRSLVRKNGEVFHVEHFCESQDEKLLTIVVVAAYARIAALAKKRSTTKDTKVLYEGTYEGDRAADSLSRKASTTEGTAGTQREV